MTTAFHDTAQLPNRSYGIVMNPHEMRRAAVSAPAAKDHKAERVTLILKALSASKEGQENIGILRVVLGTLKDVQLGLVEESLVALHNRQESHEETYGRFEAQHTDFRTRYAVKTEERLQSPYGFVAAQLLLEFKDETFVVLSKFSSLYGNLPELVTLCHLMVQQGIPLTWRNVIVQLEALRTVWDIQRHFYQPVHPYFSKQGLIRAVHKHPTKVKELIRMLSDRGSVAAADEVFGTSAPISGGAL